MKAKVQAWLQAQPVFPGLLACAVRLPDQLLLSRAIDERFAVAGLEHAGRCVADTYRVLRVQRMPARELHWEYEEARLHCARRTDDLLLLLFVSGDAPPDAESALRRWMDEFLQHPGWAPPKGAEKPAEG